MNDLVGETWEIDLKVNDNPGRALLDTGSQISAISEQFHSERLSHIPIKQLNFGLRVEGLSGADLPYLGYIECDITIPTADNRDFKKRVPILVVPNTRYNNSVPVLIGTNVLCMIPDGNLPLSSFVAGVQLAVRVMQAQVRGEIPDVPVKSLTSITLPPYTSAVVSAAVENPFGNREGFLNSNLGSQVVEGMVRLHRGSNVVSFEVANYSEHSTKIMKNQVVAVVQQAKALLVTKNKDNVGQDFLDSFRFDHLDGEEAKKLKDFLIKNRDVFAMNHNEMGCTNVINHTIELTDPEPIKDKLRPPPLAIYDELRDHVKELIEADIIRESKSPFCSNVVVAKKKDGSIRMCVDYRKVNAKTKPDAYQLPRPDTLIDCLKGSRYYASLDLISGYNQIRMQEDDREKTAFSVGSLGFYEFQRMPFGLKNSGSSFQRLMETVLQGLTMKSCLVYIDDIVVFAETKEQLYQRLQEVFERLREANLTLKPKKCSFFQESVEFLGFRVSAKGVQCTDGHVATIKDWPVPQNTNELHCFLGFTGFYRKFVAGYSRIAYPLLKLIRYVGGKKKSKKGKQKLEYVPFVWGQEEQTAFDRLKERLTNAPVLVYPDPDKPYTLHTDASRKGIGAVLYQEVGGKLHPVAYASRSLSGAEKNYTVQKLEFLALKWAITQKFHHYLYGASHFTCYTDNNPLSYVTSTAKVDANGMRWLQSLSLYNFTIKYKPGTSNKAADALSRRPHPESEHKRCTKVISPEVFTELCNVVSGDQEYNGVAESLGLAPTVVANTAQTDDRQVDWAREQDKDAVIHKVKQIVRAGRRPTRVDRQELSQSVVRYLQQWDTLRIDRGVLVKMSRLGEVETSRVVIPTHMRKECLSQIHDKMGHLGRDKTYSLAQERFYWLGLESDVKQKVEHCRRCICAKRPHLPERSPLVPIVTTRPMECVFIDFVGLEECQGGFKYVLVVTDHFTKYAAAFPTKNQEARTVARILVDQYFTQYGIPERINSDQAGSFQGRLMSNLSQMLGYEKSKTTPYHPQSDGICERFNRTLINMLRSLEQDQKRNWKSHVQSLVYAYNCTRHETTGYSPFFLLFGRKPRLPIDVFLGRDERYCDTITEIRDRLKAAYKAAEFASKAGRERQKRNYDRKVRGRRVQVGDAVLLRNVGLKGRQKLADLWQQDPFTVIDQPNNDVPVYNIQRGRTIKTVHRNLILPVELPLYTNDSLTDAGDRSSGRVASPYQQVREQDVQDNEEDFNDSDFRIEIPTVETTAEHPGGYGAPSIQPHSCHSPTVPTSYTTPCPSPISPRHDGMSVDRPVISPTPLPLSTPTTSVREVDSGEQSVGLREVSEETPVADRGGERAVLGEPELVDPEPRLRRSKRNLKQPVWYGVTSNSGIVVDGDWRDRASVLLSMIQLFPGQQHEIFNALILVVSGRVA